MLARRETVSEALCNAEEDQPRTDGYGQAADKGKGKRRRAGDGARAQVVGEEDCVGRIQTPRMGVDEQDPEDDNPAMCVRTRR